MTLRTRSHLRDFATLLGGLVFGALVALGIGFIANRDDAGATTTYAPDQRTVVIPTPSDIGPGEATAVDAVNLFLDSLVQGQNAASLALLSPSDRDQIRNVAVWDSKQASQVGTVVDYSVPVVVVDPGSNTATATSTLTLTPSLNLINGVTAPEASATWRLENDGGWRVNFASSVIEPLYFGLSGSDPDIIREAALAWLRSGGACDPSGAAGPNAVFRGTIPSLTDELCQTAAASDVGDVTDLPINEASQGLAASFGPEVRIWARVVPLDEPVAASLVLAPVDDRWVVVDVISQ